MASNPQAGNANRWADPEGVVMKVKSRDLSMEITKDSNVQERFNKLMAEFLSELPARINSIPVTIQLSVETGNDWWNFVAIIASAQHRVHWTLRLWAWLKKYVGLGLRQ